MLHHAAPQPGERVLDVGCGTGNAALLAAQHGARVVGVDPAFRLLALARADAAARRLDRKFIRGHAESLPIASGSAEAVIYRSWHDRRALAHIFARHGFSLELHDHTLAFRASSLLAFIESEFRHDPLWITHRDALDDEQLQDVREQVLAILEPANEDPDAFCLTSPYVVATARRAPADA